MRAAMDSWWEGAAKLLSAGPLGLGAIIVLVTGTILLTGNAVEQGRLKLSLSLLLAGCVLVLAGLGVLVLQTNAANAQAAAELAKVQASVQHQLYFYVEPMASEATLPAPEISINNVKLKTPSYNVQTDVTVIVDVTKAFHAINAKAQPASPPDKVDFDKKNREQLSAELDTSIVQIQRIVQLINQSCPGGPHGVNPFHFNDVVNLSNSVVSSLNSAKTAVLTANF